MRGKRNLHESILDDNASCAVTQCNNCAACFHVPMKTVCFSTYGNISVVYNMFSCRYCSLVCLD